MPSFNLPRQPMAPTQPNHPDSNHNLGVVAGQVNQPASSLPYFKVALENNPNQEQYWLSYIDALNQTGQMVRANGSSPLLVAATQRA